ncbi:hypothetical protein KI387_038451, partial [Taxus chinensis]
LAIVLRIINHLAGGAKRLKWAGGAHLVTVVYCSSLEVQAGSTTQDKTDDQKTPLLPVKIGNNEPHDSNTLTDGIRRSDPYVLTHRMTSVTILANLLPIGTSYFFKCSGDDLQQR